MCLIQYRICADGWIIPLLGLLFDFRLEAGVFDVLASFTEMLTVFGLDGGLAGGSGVELLKLKLSW